VTDARSRFARPFDSGIVAAAAQSLAAAPLVAAGAGKPSPVAAS